MSLKHKTAQEIFDLLKQEDITSNYGSMYLDYLGIKVEINDKSPVGYIMQSWLGKWLESQGIDYNEPSNSQEFPDFFLDDNNKESLLEFKSFDYDANPNFDVANFEAYCRSLKTKAYRVDADYLIFGYTLEDSKLRIKHMWLKKIWEITCPMNDYPIRNQKKQGMIYNIRPAIWYSKGAKYKPFNSREKFINALNDTLLQYYKTSMQSAGWLDEVVQNYKHHTGKDLL